MMATRRDDLWRERRGGAAMLLSGALFMMAGSAAFAVDLGSVYLAKRQLQGVADATALAATQGGQGAAEGMIGRSGVAGVRLVTLENGYYAADPALTPEQRFIAGDTRATASRVWVERRVPLYFARLLTGNDTVAVGARATAARADAAAFSIGTGLASIEGGVPNMILSSLAGTDLNLSVMDVNGLASLNIDMLGFADALRVRTGRDGDSYGALFDREVPVNDLFGALADSVAHSPTAATLRTIGGRVNGRTLALGEIIDLGPMRGSGSADGQPALVLDALTMTRMILSPPAGTAVPMDLRLAVPGLTSTRLMMITGPGEARSPMLTVTSSRDVVIRTAQTRIYLESTAAIALSGIASVRVPIYLELAGAEARLSSVDCAAGSMMRGVTLAVTPSLGTAALGEVDPHALTDLSRATAITPAALAQGIGVRVTGHATIALGGTTAQSVHFSPAEIAARQVKTVSTGDLTQGIAASLASKTEINVQILGLGLGASGVSSAIGGILGTVAPMLDSILASATSVMGVRVGSAYVSVLAQRCGIATIVG